jgi:D-cysteine desulfhydrase family pyridoxal phosphate-dependent enzyme
MKLDNRINLGFFPTPLTELKNLSKIYTSYNLFIKRDDHTGLATGGNKTRKLEYLIQEAIDEGCDTVITAGAQQSNHCRQTAAACAIADLNCHLVFGGKEPEVFNGNLLLSKILGAKIHFTGENRKGEDIDKIYSELRQQGVEPYIIPYGGSNITGALGYVNAVKELQGQLTERKLKIDYIFFASSSGGMQAGLTLGKMLYGLKAELIPINIDKNETGGHTLEEAVLAIVKKGIEVLQIKESYDPEDIPLVREYDKAGYGIVTSNETSAINLLAQSEGILLDPVYTARAFYGMMDYLEKELLPKKSNVLFWHTGGLPAIFNYAEEMSLT